MDKSVSQLCAASVTNKTKGNNWTRVIYLETRDISRVYVRCTHPQSYPTQRANSTLPLRNAKRGAPHAPLSHGKRIVCMLTWVAQDANTRKSSCTEARSTSIMLLSPISRYPTEYGADRFGSWCWSTLARGVAQRGVLHGYGDSTHILSTLLCLHGRL